MINEIAELLQERALKTPFPLELPKIEDIFDVQEQILIHIPVCFRDYLLHSSNATYGRLEPVTVADPNIHTYLPEVAAEAWGIGLPREYIPLCVDGEKIYCISEDDTVHLWQNDGEEPEEVCEDVWRWVRDIWLNS